MMKHYKAKDLPPALLLAGEIELKLVLWLPKQRVKSLVRYPRLAAAGDIPLAVASAAMEHFAELQALPTWKEQCQIALWALSRLEDDWDVFLMTDETGTIPLYYITIYGTEIKGMWKSVYGTVMQYPSNARGLGVHLLKWALSQQPSTAIIYLDARAGFIRMCEKHGIPLHTTGQIGKAQGASIPAILYVSDV